MNSSMILFSNDNESQTRHLMYRIESLEKNLLDIHSSISGYTTKIAKTRDMADALVLNIQKFCETENIETSLKQGMSNWANCLNAIQDYRDEQVKHIEEKVINDLSIYGELTKRAKEELKINSSARDKELSKDNRNKDLFRSNSLNEMPTALTAYEFQIQKFEVKKICDLKRLFLEFTKSELLFHSKAIEALTKSYKNLLYIDADKDLQEFCNFFKMSRLGSPKREDSLKNSNQEINEMNSILRRFNSVPAFSSVTSKPDEESTEKDSKSIDAIVEHLGN